MYRLLQVAEALAQSCQAPVTRTLSWSATQTPALRCNGPPIHLAQTREVLWQRWCTLSRRHCCAESALLVEAEQSAVTVVNSLSTSTPGRKLLALFPLTTQYLFAGTASCEAATAYYSENHSFSRSTAWSVINDCCHRLFHPARHAIGVVLEGVLTAIRAIYLLGLFSPAILLAPVCLKWYPHLRDEWLRLLRWTLERAGPAFIKWGQWAATRPDLLSRDVCAALESLHAAAPSHAYAHTRRAVERAFGCKLQHLFDEFHETPVASGSIAQVHKATLSERGAAMTHNARGSVVAVKVRHPGVSRAMHRDFRLMVLVASAAAWLPMLRSLRLDEGIRQFGAPLHDQLDLQREALHLQRFNDNFRMSPDIVFPTPMHPLVSQEVLVESFEEGTLISANVHTPQDPHNKQIAKLGLHLFLQMLLRDNFLHADMHPGNILVRQPYRHTWSGQLRSWLGLPQRAQVVLVDTGMTTGLSKADQLALVDLYKALTRQDGALIGEQVLRLSVGRCADEQRFTQQMDNLFSRHTASYIAAHTSEVMMEMMDIVRQHSIALKPEVSVVLVTSLVLDGWSSTLDPNIRVLDHVNNMLPLHWNERICRLTDKVYSGDAIDV